MSAPRFLFYDCFNTSVKLIQRSVLSALLCLLVTTIAEAGAIVEVQTSLGTFYLEIDEESAPLTGGNFLNYVRSGRYNNTFIHGAIGGSLIRGGGYTFANCAEGPQRIELDDPIPLEDTGLSNLDGTIAALRPASDINGATSEWFINLGADTGLDTQDGGYAVFGRVLGDGLNIVRNISLANLVRLGFFLETPTTTYFQSSVNCQQFSRDNLILVLMAVVNEDSLAATASYDAVNELLEVNVDLGVDGFIRVPFAVSVSDDQTIISARLESAVDLHQPVPNMASYDATSGRLTLPSIGIDGEIRFRNIVFELSDATSATFLLRSIEQ
ncbi:MAG: peptidylprolyl isomerase [Pseudomonadota bacterium]|nr:peptidylprolyl isomerase [Pseudomonadota bacterium]